MKMKNPGFLLLFVAGFIFYAACRKTDQSTDVPTPADQQQKFFGRHTANDPLVQTVLLKMQRENDSRPFINSIISKIGFPRWVLESKAETIFLKPYSDTTVVPQILALPLASYIGKPVDSLFKVLPANFTNRQFIPAGIGYCVGVTQGYGISDTNSCFVAIFIDHFTHLPLPNRTKTSTWNMDLAKLETIAYIKVYKNNRCVFGCGNPLYD